MFLFLLRGIIGTYVHNSGKVHQSFQKSAYNKLDVSAWGGIDKQHHSPTEY